LLKPVTVETFTSRAADNVWRGIYVRDLLRELVGREMKVRYRRSVLGVVWSLLNPLAHLLVLVFVFQRVTPLNIPDYPCSSSSACWHGLVQRGPSRSDNVDHRQP
jgi:hypothetical protein